MIDIKFEEPFDLTLGWQDRVFRLRYTELKFEPRDLWIGLYWNPTKVVGWDIGKDSYRQQHYDIYICPIPMIVFKLELTARKEVAG